VEEARRVIERLDRVEELRLAGAPAGAVLEELRALVSEAESWLAVEGTGADDALGAVDRCRRALGESPLAVSA
jgi:hypothetical protein